MNDVLCCWRKSLSWMSSFPSCRAGSRACTPAASTGTSVLSSTLSLFTPTLTYRTAWVFFVLFFIYFSFLTSFKFFTHLIYIFLSHKLQDFPKFKLILLLFLGWSGSGNRTVKSQSYAKKTRTFKEEHNFCYYWNCLHPPTHLSAPVNTTAKTSSRGFGYVS